MVWKKAVVFITLLAIPACAPTMRRIDICHLDAERADCARGDKRYEKSVSSMGGWFAVDELSLQIVAEKITDCEVAGKLPPEKTLERIEICEILGGVTEVSCAWNTVVTVNKLAYIDGYFATDKTGLQKIRAKLNYCGEKNE